MIKAIAIDDEPLALRVLEHLCAGIEGLSLEKTFAKTDEAAKYLRKFDTDLLFLDIEMPGKNGLDFYKSLNENIMVVFTTAYSEYAVEGFNVNAVDYLLKPFSAERLLQAVEKAKNQIEMRKTIQDNAAFVVRADYKLHRIEFNEIMLIEGQDDYIKIHIKDKRPVVARMSMKVAIEKLPVNQFVRVHRSYIIPLDRAQMLYNKSIIVGEFVVPVGDVYKENLYSFFNKQ